jgi:hypothetical protein
MEKLFNNRIPVIILSYYQFVLIKGSFGSGPDPDAQHRKEGTHEGEKQIKSGAVPVHYLYERQAEAGSNIVMRLWTQRSST